MRLHVRLHDESAALARWREQLVAGKAVTPPEFVHKAFASEVKQVNREARQVRFRISTSEADRMKDVVSAEGWQLDSYRKNPVVLWAHQYGGGLLGTGGVGLPIAKALSIEKNSRGLSSDAQFATREQYDFADTVYQLILGGFLNATSVGFRPLKHVFNEERQGIDFMEHELLEYSVVPIPANAEALVEAKGQGIDLGPLQKWAERVLDEVHDEPGVWVPRRQVEVAMQMLGTRTISVPRGEMSRDDCPGGDKCQHKPQCPMKKDKDNHPVPGGFTDIEDFLDATTPITDLEAAGLTEVVTGADLTLPIEGKPYPSEHACRVADPGGFSKFRRGSRTHDGKTYGVVYAKPKEGGGWQEQSYRYPKESWKASEASAHCKGHKGSFEAASSEKDEEVTHLELLDDFVLELLDDPNLIEVDQSTLDRLITSRLQLMTGELREAMVKDITATLNKLRGRVD